MLAPLKVNSLMMGFGVGLEKTRNSRFACGFHGVESHEEKSMGKNHPESKAKTPAMQLVVLTWCGGNSIKKRGRRCICRCAAWQPVGVNNLLYPLNRQACLSGFNGFCFSDSRPLFPNST